VNALYERCPELTLERRQYSWWSATTPSSCVPGRAWAMRIIAAEGINSQISSLTTQFKQNVLKQPPTARTVDSAAELEGLAAEQIGAAAAAAAARGLAGKWLLTLHNTPRSRCWRNCQIGRCVSACSRPRPPARDGAADNTASCSSWSRCVRAGRAAGLQQSCDYQLADESAGSPAAVSRILTALLPAPGTGAEDAHDLQQLVDAHAREAGFERFALAPGIGRLRRASAPGALRLRSRTVAPYSN